MRLPRPLAFASTALLFAFTPRLASAYFPFPADIQQHLALTYTPPCTICHATTAGGLPSTLVHPFGQAMLRAGSLTFTSTEAEVDAALDDLAATKNDSDCNGIPDIEQLEQGRDPNPPGEYIDGSNKPTPDDEPDAGCGDALQPVLYGCGVQRSPAPPSGDGSAALGGVVAALGLVLTRRRRRGPPGRRALRTP
jgi:hypothetical protein